MPEFICLHVCNPKKCTCTLSQQFSINKWVLRVAAVLSLKGVLMPLIFYSHWINSVCLYVCVQVTIDVLSLSTLLISDLLLFLFIRFFPWSRSVIVFPVPNVTLTHLLPLQQNPIFADTLSASASVNMFSKSHWCVFFSVSANGRLVIRLIILIHLDRIKPTRKRSWILKVMSYSKEFRISVSWMQTSETIFLPNKDLTLCMQQCWVNNVRAFGLRSSSDLRR